MSSPCEKTSNLDTAALTAMLTEKREAFASLIDSIQGQVDSLSRQSSVKHSCCDKVKVLRAHMKEIAALVESETEAAE